VSAALRFERGLDAAFRRSDEIFALLDERDLLERPISLRHPFLFYLGHLPAFAWNQIGRGALQRGDLHHDFDRLFERGIDPGSEQAAEAASREAWPSVAEVVAYRDDVRRAIRGLLGDVLAREGDPLCARGRVIHLVIEHELMHHETLMYMIEAHRSRVSCADLQRIQGGDGRAAEPRRVGAGSIVIGADFDALPFGWDNEIGRLAVDVPAFTIDSLPVRNSDYRRFLDAQPESARAALTPLSWIQRDPGWGIATVFGSAPFDLAAGFPVRVSGLMARAYAAWAGGRLPTEAEIRRAALSEPGGGLRPYPWGHDAPEARHGNFGFRQWTPVATGSHPEGVSAWGVEELVGNGWEWTQTPFRPLPGFFAWARTYPGYSADFFDDEHDVVFGASWATDDRLLRPTFRNWYRRDYPHVFSSFRVVRDA
jgi:formylglycine-generating enzyme required for sulfatase activity